MQFLKAIKDLKLNVAKQSDELLRDCGMIYEVTAKRNAPVKTGHHQRNITFQVKHGRLFMFANAAYAAYLEFGTGTEINIPYGFKAMARPWKGKGIRKINLKARPHIIPASFKAAEYYEKNIVKIDALK